MRNWIALFLVFSFVLHADCEPKEDDRFNLWLNADALFLIPSEDAIVLTNHKTNLFNVNDITLEPTLHTQFKWDFGSRVGVGYFFGCWDVAFNWTRYSSYTMKKSDTRGNIAEGMFPIWSLASDIIQYDWISFAKMRWNLGLNLLDLDFGYNFQWDWFFLRPYVGLRSAWIDQEFDVYYGGGIFPNGLNLYARTNNCGYDHMHMENEYWGLGPQIGVEPLVNLGWGFCVYANASGSLEGGYFHLVQNETYMMASRYANRRHPAAFRWILDASGGLMWGRFICCERFGLSFKLGWEYHVFFNQFALHKDRFDLVPDNNNLVLNGAVFSGRFDF